MNTTTDGSDSQWELVEEIAESLEMSRPINYVDLAVFVVLLFEYFITIDCEVRLAWGRNLSCARVICLLNRYFSLFLNLLALGPLLPARNLVGCEAITFMMQTLAVLLYAVWAAFSGLRIYAISNYSRRITLAVVSLALVATGTNIYLETQITAVYFPDIGCVTEVDLSWSVFRRLTVITRSCWITFEIIVIVVTWLNTTKGLYGLWTSSNTSFTELVLREGIMYFGVLLSFNVMQISASFYESASSNLILAFADPLTAILISRFYFALDDLQAQQFTTTLPSARDTTLQFAISKITDGTHSGDNGNDDEIICDAQVRDGLPPPVPPKDVYN